MGDSNSKNPANSDKPNAEFQHNAGENVQTVAFCSVFPQSEDKNKSNRSADYILRAALDPKTIKLATRPVRRMDHNATSETARPSDFGEHEPIPEEAVTMVPVAEGGEDE